MMRRCGRHTAAVLMALGAFGCTREDERPRVPLGQPPTGAAEVARAPLSQEAQAALNRGNDAYRAKRYPDALAAYRDAVAASPNHPAPWFGIQMAATSLRNTALADSATRRIRALSPQLGDSVGNPHGTPPPGHPTP